ncbi:Mov34/MPN/PAD-1 family protein [Prauserella alba]|uniref:Mov34/MPN/PAD-1 family protein n=1 Tax=Prauserella alba TaxID=176898 RepID=UPI0020A550C7|nr:M67 family metallopeptidase [Prauserella alba]MCP2179221.1 Proteasome lid subunit RPN8/RPN11, contains Jab1/MPN metalloenzyme (JAMM) motif [Prauserella alba]
MGDVLRIRRDHVDAIVAHARRDHPDEACGVIAGPDDGSDTPERYIPMVNAARSPTFYEFDSGDLLKLYREMAAADETPVVIYHSHTATEAYPSRTDIAFASEPFAHYVLVSTRDEHVTEFRSYRIVEGEVTEEPVQIVGDAGAESAAIRLNPDVTPVESYMFANTGSDDVPDA